MILTNKCGSPRVDPDELWVLVRGIKGSVTGIARNGLQSWKSTLLYISVSSDEVRYKGKEQADDLPR